MGAVAFASDRWLQSVLPQASLFWQIVQLGAAIAVALAVLAASAWLLRIQEFNDSMQMVLRRLRRK